MIAAPEFGLSWGGIGTYLEQLIHGLRPAHEVTVLCGKRAPAYGGVRTIPLLREAGNIMAMYLRFQIALRRQLPGLARALRPDLLVVHHAQMPDLLASPPGCPVVVTTHTTLYAQARGSLAALRCGSPLDGSERTTLASFPALLIAEGMYWRRVSNALFVSDTVRDEVEGRYAPRLHTATTVPNGFAVEDREHPWEGDPPEGEFLLFTGRLLGWKGVAPLLQALTHLKDDTPLFLTGSGNLAVWERYARALGLSPGRVQFLGFVPRPRLLQLLQAARVVVLPSFVESCPYSLMEAMAFGKPIVATSIPGFRGMVDDSVSALLVAPGDPVALAGALERLQGDEALRSSLGQAAARRASERFGLQRMCTETLEFFERVLVRA